MGIINKKNSTHKIIEIAILTTSLYVVSNNLPPIVGSFRYFWAPLALVAIFLEKRSIFGKKPMVSLILYGAISLGVVQYTLWSNMSAWDRKFLLEEFFSLIFFFTILLYYYVRRDFKGLARIGYMAFWFISVTIIMTHIALFFDPMVVRQSIGNNFTPYQAKIAKITGAGGYGYMQALVCLIPILVYHIKLKKKMVFAMKGLIIILCLILILMLRAQVLANLLVAVAITILSFTGTKYPRRSFFLVALTLVVFWVIPSSFYADQLVFVNSYLDSSSTIHYKLKDLSFFLRHQEFDASSGAGHRAERYPMLYKAFIAAPILGDSSYNSPFDRFVAAGGHLYWMNKLAIWGVLGFLFYLYVLFQIYKCVSSLFDDNFGFYYLLSVGAFVSLGLIKTIAGREPFLMLIVIIPGLYFLPLLKHTRTKNKKISN